jgi:hypothetical protein
MALILSAATGNFNAGATWVGGIVPGPGDEARASTTHTITITANVTCDEVSNAGSGIYTLNDGITLTANVTNKTTTAARACMQFFGASATIVGNVTSGPATTTIGINNVSTGTVNVTGTVTGGSGSNAYGLYNSSTGRLVVTGNVTGGSGGSSNAVQGQGNGNITITGNVTASGGLGVNNVGTGTVTITGNVLASGALGVSNASTGTVTITGNSTGAGAAGVNNASTGTVTITGIATAGTTGAGVNNASTGTINLGRAKANAYGPGNTSGLSPTPGASNAGLGIIEIQEIEYGTFGQTPVSGTGIRLKKASTNVAVFNYCDTAGAKTLIDATANAAMPAITDVRFGTSYASGALTGVAYIPSASSVGFGVPVDNTTGTATLTAADVRAALGMASANLDTQLADLPTASENANAVWDELMSAHTTSGTYGGRIVRATNANTELQINAQNHAAANVHQFQTAVIESAAFATSAVTLFTGAMRTELTPELTEITEVQAIHGLDLANALTVTPTSRTSGAITQSISGDGTTNTVVTRV